MQGCSRILLWPGYEVMSEQRQRTKPNPSGPYQQEQKRSPGSESPKADDFRTTSPSQRSSSRNLALPPSPVRLGGLDTVVLTRRFLNPLELRGEWEPAKSPRWNHTTKVREHGWVHLDAGDQGWWLDYLPARNVLEVTLQIPKIMGESLANYPILDFHWSQLARPAHYIMREIGISYRLHASASECLGWEYFGVRSAHYTIDLPVPNKTALIRTLGHYQRAGKRRTFGDETVQWMSGSKTVQIYDKGAQLRATLGKSAFDHVTRHHPELPWIARLEVRLQSSELRALFGLPPGWLPKLAPVADPKVIHWVLQNELFRGFKIDRIGPGLQGAADLISSRADEILRQVAAEGGGLAFPRLCQILVAGALIEHHKKAELVERFGVSRAQLNKLLQWSRQLGIVPGLGATGASSKAFRDMVLAYRRAYPQLLSRRPGLRDQEASSVDASWIEEPDYLRPVEGIIVDEDETGALTGASLLAAIEGLDLA